MSDLIDLMSGATEQQSVADFTEKAYLNYSMYVIMDRALPHLGDGLKPVQRRIIYAMSELGLDASSKHKKSARTVGDVLGKFHPHGDSACYEAMVLMAQPFSYRYPLVDGQGNWGAPDDPKSFAAMRYTESRLSAYASLLLSELGQGTVQWQPNFDGSLEEPCTLPARLPNILLNGTTGIAVGMATDIPPHNILEVVQACLHLLDKPQASVETLCQYIQGPDFPTDAEIITSPDDILKMYTLGRGSVRMRARYKIEDGNIVVYALPHQVSGSRVIEQIATLMTAKKLPQISDIRDESDHENPTRIVLIPKNTRGDHTQTVNSSVMQHLFAATDMENSYRINLNVIGLDGRPQVKPLNTLLNEWLSYRIQTVRRRLIHRLEKVERRLQVLEALLVVYLNLDAVIRIIREEEQPKAALMNAFGLSELQVDYILDTRLRQLARLEEMKIEQERLSLESEHLMLEDTLSHDDRLRKLIKQELKADAKTYGDARRSAINPSPEAKVLPASELLSVEPVTVLLSENGWIRSAKGHDINPLEMAFRSGDQFQDASKGHTNQSTIILDSTGRSYSLMTHQLPSARGQGEPLTGKLTLPTGAKFLWVLLPKDNDFYLMHSNAGYGFITPADGLSTRNKAGRVLMLLSEQSILRRPLLVCPHQSQSIAMVTMEGRLLVFSVDALPIMNKGKGLKMMHLSAECFMRGEDAIRLTAVLSPGTILKIRVGKKILTFNPNELDHYRGERGKRGHLLPKGFLKADELITD